MEKAELLVREVSQEYIGTELDSNIAVVEKTDFKVHTLVREVPVQYIRGELFSKVAVEHIRAGLDSIVEVQKTTLVD